MFSNLGSGEIIVVLLIVMFLFGGKKLPELARGLGESGKELKKAKKEIEKALDDITTDQESKDKASEEEENTEGGEPS